MSALPPNAHIDRHLIDIRFVPIAAIATACYPTIALLSCFRDHLGFAVIDCLIAGMECPHEHS
jgi:hypothetical protein